METDKHRELFEALAELSELQDKADEKEASVKGTGRFSNLTYGCGKPKKGRVLGSNPQSMDWNGPEEQR